MTTGDVNIDRLFEIKSGLQRLGDLQSVLFRGRVGKLTARTSGAGDQPRLKRAGLVAQAHVIQSRLGWWVKVVQHIYESCAGAT